MYIGRINHNDILSGKVFAQPGDTFIAQSIDNHGFAAFRYQPNEKATMPYENFCVLATGTWDRCKAAVSA